MSKASIYRTHTCDALIDSDVGRIVTISGWLHGKRDHGGTIFADIRDHYGMIQIVIDRRKFDTNFTLESVSLESVLTITGIVCLRNNPEYVTKNPSGAIEILVHDGKVLSRAKQLPFQINDASKITDEDVRLKYRFLDLRRSQMHANMILRSNVIRWLREKMHNMGFHEFHTPILTATSPEGAHDFIVPSRVHKGKFYALPQAPQQFKQLLMVSGFDRYFQIAPCFRDENSRADRSPGEFYQLDLEMSFVEENDVLEFCEKLMYDLFTTFSSKKVEAPFPRMSYADAMLKYGTDKPDLRNPIVIHDVTDLVLHSNCTFKSSITKNSAVKALVAKNAIEKSKSFFNEMTEFAIKNGASGMSYIILTPSNGIKGSASKWFSEDQITDLMHRCDAVNNDAIFFICDLGDKVAEIAGIVRNELGRRLGLIQEDVFKFVWITDMPFFERSRSWDGEKKPNPIDFCHNPFSKPKCTLDELCSNDIESLLNIKSYQYDIVCNGVEISSGAIRNSDLDIFYKVFNIVGYSNEQIDAQFGAIVRAYQFGVPPHGGIAPGIERILMLLTNEVSIRELVAFPMNGSAEDRLMGAPTSIDDVVLKRLGLILEK